MAPDNANLDRALAGDPDAFVAIMKVHNKDLRALAYSIVRDASVLDDVMQEAFIKAFRSVSGLRNKAGFRAWIHRIVYTTAVDEVRHRQRVVPMEVPDQASQSSVDWKVTNKLDINDALWRIPGPQRVAVILVDDHGFDYQTAADILHVPAGTLASRVNAGRSALRRLLQVAEREA